MKLAECRVGIVGLGLMGGSLAEALEGRCRRLIGVDRDGAVVAEAARQGLVDFATQDLAAAADSDLLILAVPVRASLALMAAMGSDLPAPRRLLDLGSTKRQVVAAMERLPAATDAVGGHPMCGKEVGGLAARDGSLFRGSRFVVTPLARTGTATLDLVGELIRAVGAEEVRMSAEDHDRLVAVTSHLPYLAAAALVDRAGHIDGEDPRLQQVTASGFRDTTRLSATDPAMMIDVLLTNQDNIARELAGLRADLLTLEGHLREGRQAALQSHLQAIKERKDRWDANTGREDGSRGA